MRSPSALLEALALVAATMSVGVAAGRSDLAVLRMQVPVRVKLGDARPKASGRAVVRIANRGSVPVVVADAATLAAVVRLTAATLEGPIACAPLVIAPPRVRFPLTLRPRRARTLRYKLDFTCGANPDRTPDWAFNVSVDRGAIDGTADENPTDDVCPPRAERVGSRL